MQPGFWMNDHRCVYVDETNFNLWTSRSKGRSKRGMQCCRTVGGQRGRNVNIIMAVSSNGGLIMHREHIGGITRETFQSFIDGLSQKLDDDSPQEKTYIIFDNAPCHRNASSTRSHHIVKYLPPWSPMLNPIEEAFSCLKAEIKKKLSSPPISTQIVNVKDIARQEGSTIVQVRQRILMDVLNQSYASITPTKVSKFCGHLNRVLPRAYAEESM